MNVGGRSFGWIGISCRGVHRGQSRPTPEIGCRRLRDYFVFSKFSPSDIRKRRRMTNERAPPLTRIPPSLSLLPLATSGPHGSPGRPILRERPRSLTTFRLSALLGSSACGPVPITFSSASTRRRHDARNLVTHSPPIWTTLDRWSVVVKGFRVCGRTPRRRLRAERSRKMLG